MKAALVRFAFVSGLRIWAYFVCAAIALVMWLISGFPHVAWVAGLVGSVLVGCTVMLAKGPQRPMHIMAAIALMLAMDALLVLGLINLGFVSTFIAWGIAHLAGILTSQIMVFGASGAAIASESDDAVAEWTLSRGFVIGIGSAIVTAACGQM